MKKAKSFGDFVNEFQTPSTTQKTYTREHLTDAQYAVMFMLFKGKLMDLPQPYRSMQEKDLRILAGLSDQTLRHRKREMAILAGGEDRALKGDEYFEELLSKVTDRETLNVEDMRRTARVYYTFNEMPLRDVAAIAVEAFTDDNKEKGEFYHNKNIAQQSKYAQDRKVKTTDERKKIIQYVSDFVRSFSTKMSPAEARVKAILAASRHFSKPDSDIKAMLEGK